MQTVQVVANHEVKRKTGAGELGLLPVTVYVLRRADPFGGAAGGGSFGLVGSDVG
jgi:hypothetical protein